ncbi:diacylglycerol kinase [Microbacterium sp. 10M-3C3]|uniref:diacylglycerol kinase n=1 Tax=Microbacterium sp. 10M-3C3 TaxID=2483401 RepID=UPI000F640B37|nr:diacylglycerol kinase [Microbacterium sp. 10M-3C3]
MHVALLANPAARGGTAVAAAERAVARLRTRGIRTTVLSGGSAEETTALLRAALEADVSAVAVAGGDGTVHAALQELAGTDVPLGVIPCGTGNDLARALGLRRLHPEAAADVIADGRTRRVDLARVTRADGSERLFATVLASGFDARVNDRANAMRRPRGRARYLVAILREFVALRPEHVTLSGVSAAGAAVVFDGEATLVAVGNTPSYGGGIPMCPAADVADGLLDVTVVRPVGRLELLRLLPRAYRGTHVALAQVSTWRLSSVRISGAGGTAYADGEPIADLPLTAASEPAAVRMFVPVS